MPINIAEWKSDGKHYTIEISNDKLFLQRVKEIDKEFKKEGIDPQKIRKVRTVGDGRVQADVQRLIDGPKENPFGKLEQKSEQTPAEKLEELRAALHAENISQGELIDLQGMVEHIDPSDFELLEAAGVTEEEANAKLAEHRVLETVSSEESIAGDVILPEPKHKV